jgi:hypothetical protein
MRPLQTETSEIVMFSLLSPHNLILMLSPTRCRAILISATLAWPMLFATNPALAQIPKPTDAPKPMAPEQSAAAFKLPDGFRMELVPP